MPGRRDIARGTCISPYATRRSGMTDLPNPGFALSEGDHSWSPKCCGSYQNPLKERRYPEPAYAL